MDVLQIAGRALVAAGFEATTSDAAAGAAAGTVAGASAGTLTAQRTWRGAAGHDLLICRMPGGAAMDTSWVTTLAITVTARARGPVTTSGSDVRITSTTRAQYPRGTGTAAAPAPGETDCVSRGIAEQQLAAALK